MTPPTTGAADRSPLQDFLFDRARANRQQHLDAWLSKAQLIRRLAPDAPWPAWSAGETLAVAILLGDVDRLAAQGYTVDEALDRLRFDIGAETIAEAREAFDQLRVSL